MDTQGIISSGLLEVYAMGLANEKETAQVLQWINQYPQVSDELNAIQLALEEYAQIKHIKPSDTVKSKIFMAIQASNTVKEAPIIPLPVFSDEAPVKQVSYWWRWGAAAAVVLLVGSSILNFTYYNKFKAANINLKSTEKELAYEREYRDEMTRDMSIVQSKYSEPLMLHGMDAAPDAAAKIFWMKNTGDIYIDPSNLPYAPSGKQYQLWAIVDGKPVDAGVIISSKKGQKYRMQKMKTFGRAEAFAVTLEKEGGNKSPSLDKMYVMGKI